MGTVYDGRSAGLLPLLPFRNLVCLYNSLASLEGNPDEERTLIGKEDREVSATATDT